MTTRTTNPGEKLLSRTAVTEDGCWIFTGAWNRDGYGSIRYAGKTIGAHRIAYEAFIGPIPEGMSVLHSCDVRACVNPDHLWLGTQDDNVQDMIAKGRQNFCSNVKLTEEQVGQIKELALENKLTMEEIGELFGVSDTTVCFIKHGLTWGWLEDDSSK